MWTGHPNDEIIPILAKEWNIEKSREGIFMHLGDDCRWVGADSAYKHPEGLQMFNPTYGGMRKSETANFYECLSVDKRALSARGCFADVETGT